MNCPSPAALPVPAWQNGIVVHNGLDLELKLGHRKTYAHVTVLQTHANGYIAPRLIYHIFMHTNTRTVSHKDWRETLPISHI